MERPFIEERKFENIDFTETSLAEAEYENCTFSICNFSSIDLAGFSFTECVFTGCNLSLTAMTNTMLKDIKFIDCKLVGVHFDKCKDLHFKVHFESCILNLSSFYKMKLKNIKFQNSSLHEVDFADCDLSNASFINCDMAGTVFENTILEKADFRTAYNYSIDPDQNRIKKAKFSLQGITGLLHKYDIEIE